MLPSSWPTNSMPPHCIVMKACPKYMQAKVINDAAKNASSKSAATQKRRGRCAERASCNCTYVCARRRPGCMAANPRRSQLAEQPLDAPQRRKSLVQQHPGRQHEVNAVHDAQRHSVRVGVDVEGLHLLAGRLRDALADMFLQADRRPLFGSLANDTRPRKFVANVPKFTIDSPEIVHPDPEHW